MSRHLPASRRALAVLLAVACTRAGNDGDSTTAAPPPAAATAPKPLTGAAISEGDLRMRVYAFADDSMLGRGAPGEGDLKATRYLVAELERLGLRPGGENGTFFQEVPAFERAMDPGATLSVDGFPLRYGVDFLPTSARPPLPLEGVGVIYGGVEGGKRQISSAAAKGKFVVIDIAKPRGLRYAQISREAPERFRGAAGVAYVNLDLLAKQQHALITGPVRFFEPDSSKRPGPVPVVLSITRDAADRLLGAPIEERPVGSIGGIVRGDFRVNIRRMPGEMARTVLAILPGSDPALRGQYVAVGTHKDHFGHATRATDHDSSRVEYHAHHRATLQGRKPTAEELSGRADSLTWVGPARRDSIYNGADDGASGSMALLEIAEALAATQVKPARSILFVWHTAAEDTLMGSALFTKQPTVPLDSIVAYLGADMIGRGSAWDVKGGGDDYLAIAGHRRLSRNLGDLIDSVNARQPKPFRLDASWDAPDHPEGMYERSDAVSYARAGIPSAFLFTGLHADYHRITDEAQYIEYPHYARIVQYLADLVVELANRPERVKRDR